MFGEFTYFIFGKNYKTHLAFSLIYELTFYQRNMLNGL